MRSTNAKTRLSICTFVLHYQSVFAPACPNIFVPRFRDILCVACAKIDTKPCNYIKNQAIRVYYIQPRARIDDWERWKETEGDWGRRYRPYNFITGSILNGRFIIMFTSAVYIYKCMIIVNLIFVYSRL